MRFAGVIAAFLCLVFLSSGAARAGEWEPLKENQNKYISEQRFTLTDIYFINSQKGWIVGGGYGDERLILYTTDGGKTWLRQSRQGKVAQFSFMHRGIQFVDDSTGWIVGDRCEILYTSTGGLAWIPQDCGIPHVGSGRVKLPPPDLFSVNFADDKNGWAVGFFGTITHTDNGGITWVQQTSGTTENLWDVFFVDHETGWAVGGRGTILHTSSGGNKRFMVFGGWKKQKSGTGATLRGVYFIDKNNGWVVGDGGMSHTSDGGKTWETQARFKKVIFRKVFFIDRNRGWAVGTNRNNRTGAIAYTEDGGKNWQLQPSGTIY